MTELERRAKPRVVTGMPSVQLTKTDFLARFRERFYDPLYDGVSGEIDRVGEVAWQACSDYHKSPRTKTAGRGFADSDFDLPVECLATRAAIHAAEKRQRSARSPSRFLIVNGSARSDHTCPGEMSKTFRLAKIAQRLLEKEARAEVDRLDLAHLASEYGRDIHPCKACVSTAMPLCNWPCSCYPNHALGQVQDWMAEIYPRWAAAHGVMITTPVNWYQAPSALKLMIDRLVCADGGNPDPSTPDPSTTGGKDPARAKQLELDGWNYPKHLAGRAFSVVVHGDAAGVETLRRILVDWLTDMELIPAGPRAGLGRYLGYYAPYATSHDDLDADTALQEEVRNAARSLCATVREIRSRCYRRPDAGLTDPREK